jgi:GT2 family glycosyltransferase
MTGFYDERFFMYFEDFDLSRRINKLYKTVYYSDVHVFHEYERGAQKSLILFKIFIQSAIKYFNKWGWFFDNERRAINKATLKNLKLSL